MPTILIGLGMLLILAVAVGAATHWLIGMAVVIVPVVVTVLRLKLSPEYRSTTDKTMTAALGD